LIVRCANCHTEFSLDDHQIGPEGATVRCSVCSYVFAVEPPQGAGEHPWQIRTVEDLLFTAPDLATLRTWIAEGRLHPDDQVSRTGKHWLRLGDMPEFSPAFSGFSDLPQVIEEIEPPPGSALEELGPPPGFGETMPVIQGVDTGILVVRPETPGEFEVPVTARSAAVERALGRAPTPPAPSPMLATAGGETSGPEPFPLAELPVHDDDEAPRRGPTVDESAVRMRPRPHGTSGRVPSVSAVPEIVDDEPVEKMRHRPSRPTVRYGAEEVHGAASMLDAVTHAVDDDEGEEGADVRPTAAAVERTPVVPREPSGKRRAAVPAAPLPPAASSPRPAAIAPEPDDDEEPVERAPAGRRRTAQRDLEPDSFDDEPVEPRRRSRASEHDLDDRPRRSAWPLVAGLGLLAGVAVVFGVPSIRAKVLGMAGDLAGREATFDPASLAELEQARAAMTRLDPVALGRAEAALQGRLDAGNVPSPGIAAMKLAQAELLATRALDHAIGRAAGAPAPDGPTDDAERATQVLGGVVAEDVLDRDHMRRVRALVRLAQGLPAAEILPLLPEDDSGELRQLVEAAPLWRDPAGPMPAGVVAGLEALPERTTLAELALALAYLRAGDEAKAQQVADAVLGRVPGQPSALALRAKAGGAAVGSPPAESEGKATEGKATEGKATEGKATEGKATEADPVKPEGSGAAKPKVESVDSLIDRGCRLVESGDAGEGLDVLRKAKARRASDPDLLVCIGKGYAKQGRTRDALEAYDDALRVSPRFAAALQGAARAADKLGETAKAVDYYRKFLSVRPGDDKALAYIKAHGG
jgi:predicted Zn finger-like uncharacterized protein